MVKPMYSIWDKKIKNFCMPVVEMNEAGALRNFEALVTDPKYSFSRNPGDYDLVFIGDWDDEKGILIPLSSPDFVTNGLHVKIEKERWEKAQKENEEYYLVDGEPMKKAAKK